MHEFNFEGIGTYWTISYFDKDDALDQSIVDIVEDFDHKYSRFRIDSILYSLKDKKGVFKVGEEFVNILKLYFEFYFYTKGSFTPLVGITLEDLGYDKSYSFVPNKYLRSVPPLDASIKILSRDTIEVLKPVTLDFGALGKGFLIDKIYDFLISKNIDEFIINGGGDIRFFSKSNTYTEIALEHPINPNLAIGIYRLQSGKSICASSRVKRVWKGHSHIIDLSSKSSSDEFIASWVVADNATIADALATIALLSNSADYKFPYTFKLLLIGSKQDAVFSDGFKNCLFLGDN